MTSSVLDLASQRIKKLKLYLEHMESKPIHFESPLDLEKHAIYKPLSPAFVTCIETLVNNNMLHQYNEDYFIEFKQELAEYLNVENFNSENLFISANLYNFYEYLTELFLQKNQKVLVFTSSEFNYEQEVKYINSGRIVVEHFREPANTLSEINRELQKDDYKVVVISDNDFDVEELKDFIDLLPENVVLVLKSNNPQAFSFINYGTKTVMVLREFPPVMTVVEPPLCFAASRKEVISLFNNLQLPNHLDSINLFIGRHLTSYENPNKISIKSTKRISEGYEDILMSLVRENIETIEPKKNANSLFDVSRRLKIPIEDVMDFSSGKHFLGLSEDLKTNLLTFIESQEAANYYSKRTLLRNVIANHISQVQRKFHYNNILIGSGVSGLLESITRAFVNDGEGYKKLYKDKVLLLDFSPDNYKRVVEKRDALVEFVNLKVDLDVDLDELIKKIHKVRPKLILIDNPRLFTGSYLYNEQLERLLSELPENTIVVFDESMASFADFENNDFVSAVNYVEKYPNVIVLKSLSYLNAMAGMRLGYAVAQEHIIHCIDSVRHPFDVSPFAIYLGIKIFEDSEIFEKVTLKFVQEQKEYFYQALSELGLFYIKSATNSIMFRSSIPAEELQERLLPYKILVKTLKDRFVRISVSEQNQNKFLIKSLKIALAGHLHN